MAMRLWSVVASQDMTVWPFVEITLGRRLSSGGMNGSVVSVIAMLLPPRRWNVSGQRFQIGDKLDDLPLAHRAGEIRHDWRKPGHAVFVRQQNAIAQIGLVGGHRPPVGKMHGVAIDAAQIRGVHGRAGRVAAGTAE